MALTLTLQNETSLPDGGPLSVTVRGKRGIDIGRDSHLDWCLPDPGRFVSGKHCEVRWRDGGYWLHDVSTNGTFVNGSDRRMAEPHKLRNNDRIVIGHYIVGVTLDGEEAQSAPSSIAKPAASYEEIWDAGSPAPPAIDPRDLRARPTRAPGPDFLDWAVDVPSVAPPPRAPPRAPQREAAADWGGEDMAWAPPKPAPPPPAPPPAVPAPRRPQYPAEPGVEPRPRELVAPETFAPRRPGIMTDPPFSQAPADLAPPATSPAMPKAAPFEAFVEQRPIAPATAYAPDPLTPDPPAPPPYTPNPLTPNPLAPPPYAPPSAAHTQGSADFVAAFARAAGLPDGSLARLSADDLANLLGAVVQGITEDIMKLLSARAEARRVTRASNQTLIQALDNNPLKFAPSPSEAMRIMFGPANRSYLDARRAFGEALDDLKTHQVLTFTAMQRAMQMLMEDLSPEEIDKSIGKDRGLAAVVGSRKARAYDIYVARWQAKANRQENGILGALLWMFAQAYEEAERKQRPAPDT